MLKNAVKGSVILILAQTMTRAVAFFYNLFLARSLGVSDYGLYTVALAYLALVATFSDFGISRYLIREVAKSQARLNVILMTTLIWRLLSSALVLILFYVGLSFIDPDANRVSLSSLAMLTILPQAIAITLDNIFIGFEKLSLSALGLVVLSLSSTVSGFYLVINGFGVEGAVYAVVAGEIIYALCLCLLLLKLKISFSVKINVRQIKDILIGSLPYGLIAVLGLLYFRIDTLILSYMEGSFDTGIYGAAYKFLDAITFVPAAVGLALFPSMTKMHESGFRGFRKLSFKIIGVMGGLGVIVALAFIIILPLVIKWLLPSFLPSIDAIRILSLAVPFMFIHIPLSQIVLATDRYLKPIIFLSLINVLFNVVFNIIFIPEFGFIGASWVTVFSDIFSLLALLYLFQKYLFRHEEKF